MDREVRKNIFFMKTLDVLYSDSILTQYSLNAVGRILFLYFVEKQYSNIFL